jgi:CRISPR/Cas system endoribonuclease Cas6 (RAMP superfamily)
MTTHFITAEIDLQESPVQLNQAIETELQKRGEPLRWAVTSVDIEKQKAHVEAIVTVESDVNAANPA